MNIPKWVKEFYDEWGFYPICGGKSSSKSKKAEQTAAEQRMEAERKAGEETQKASLEAEQKLIKAGQAAREQMRLAGEPTAEETERRERYKTKALTPGETLMTQAGPISQAVARRIQERVEQPGLDYTRDLPAYAQGISEPLWRSLKARGIVPPPGTEGGGLGTQQFMKGAEPALAELRARAVSEDIARGEEYGVRARNLQALWTEIESILGEAIRGRQFEAGIRGAEAEQLGTREGAPYEVTGAQARGAGQTAAAAINQAEVQARYAKKDEEKAAIGKMAAMIVLGAISGGAGAAMLPAAWGVSAGAGALAGAAGGGMAALGGGGGGGGMDATQLALLNRLQQPTPTTIPSAPPRLSTLSQRYEEEYALPSVLRKRIYAKG